MPVQQTKQQTNHRHVSKAVVDRETSSSLASVSSSNRSSIVSTSHRRDLLDGSSQEVSRTTLMEKLRKRGRVESANCEPRAWLNYAERDRAEDKTCFESNSLFSSTMETPVRDQVVYPTTFSRQKKTLKRPHSAPNLMKKADDEVIARIFPDICPRALRIAEVKSWKCQWMEKTYPILEEIATLSVVVQPTQEEEICVPAIKDEESTILMMSPSTDAHTCPVTKDLDNEIELLTDHLSLEEKEPQVPLVPQMTERTVLVGTPSPVATPRSRAPLWKAVKPVKKGVSGNHVSKRPQLRLKLEDMPTPQQAEERAQRAATRLIAKRDAMEAAAITAAASSGSSTPANGPSAAQQAMMRLNLSSESDSGLQSPNDNERHSTGSAYSPNHGMFTTRSVAVSEAGISSPDAACLHLQENLERVKEVGRGASGVVYKAIHIPTLKVVAVKVSIYDVPVYGRGQRRQMVRELHALYSNLVPMADNNSPMPQHPPAGRSTGKPTAKYVGYNESPLAMYHRLAEQNYIVMLVMCRPSPYIVSFYDAFVDRPKNSICMVMEYMSTGSLQDIVLRGGCQNERVLARLATGVLYGLSHIHNKRMVHRDIKPHNLLTNRQGDVKISDFGLARTLNDSSTTTKTFVGTLLYMAPERIGGGDYSYPADVWSFGLAMISVALGRYPLPTQDGFFGLVDSCLTLDPEERPTADALLQHPFIYKYTDEETLAEWTSFIDRIHLCKERDSELESLGDAVYRHMYEHSVKFSHMPQVRSIKNAHVLLSTVSSWLREHVCLLLCPSRNTGYHLFHKRRQCFLDDEYLFSQFK
ncbi:hypothetical protein DD238_000939 [Peronospora effusa]|uniref:mitogen-activated protein kinase kinase n=1 Tax=Peronospora effusa TaxID=542832 RepID=A0A3M6VKN1_9STRA|nr:hypothetical protein DD238_000939 [Peronospora effusa]